MTSEPPTNFPYTATAYIAGSATSIAAGYIGMRIAVYSNTRTTFMCCRDVNDGFLTAFRGGQVLGFVLVGLAILVLEIILIIYKASWFDGALENLIAAEGLDDEEKTKQLKDLVRRLFELVAGYGLGGSSVALFGRVGGGIYTKAADVGADLVGKTLMDLKEDDPSNPGTIADNVGDNVGDIAGMGADLFGSLAESTCAALVVSSTSIELIDTVDALYFPLMITGAGIIASFISVLFVHAWKVSVENVQAVLKWQIALSTIFMSALVIPVIFVLPKTFNLPRSNGDVIEVTQWLAYGCIMMGLWSGMVIGFVTEYYTSNAYGPTLYLAESCEMGPAPNVMQGLALGYISCIIPILCLAATIGFSFTYAGLYGIASACSDPSQLPSLLMAMDQSLTMPEVLLRCPDSQAASETRLMLSTPPETPPLPLVRDSLLDPLPLSDLLSSVPSLPESENRVLISSCHFNSAVSLSEPCSHTPSLPSP